MHMKKYKLAIKKTYKEDNKIYLNRKRLRIIRLDVKKSAIKDTVTRHDTGTGPSTTHVIKFWHFFTPQPMSTFAHFCPKPLPFPCGLHFIWSHFDTVSVSSDIPVSTCIVCRLQLVHTNIDRFLFLTQTVSLLMY